MVARVSDITKQAAAQYVRADWKLVAIPRGTKRPLKEDWNKPDHLIDTEEKALRVNGNIGLAHAFSGTVCIDIDDLNLAREWLATHGISVDDLLAAPDAVRIISGRPNRDKLLYAWPRGIAPPPTKSLKEHGIEFRGGNSKGTTVQDVLPPSIHPDTGRPYQWHGDWRSLPQLPYQLLVLWHSLVRGDQVERAKEPAGLSIGYLRELLKSWNPDCGREEWLKVGMALHHETNGSEEGLDLYDEWSAQAVLKYEGREDCQERWESFGRNPGREITVAYLQTKSGVGGVCLLPDLPQLPPEDAKRVATIVGPEASRATRDEIFGEPFRPREIVANYLPEDAGIAVGQGGVGKSTVLLHEAVHIALGRPLYGRAIVRRGASLVVTGEDERAVVLGRLNLICAAMGLTDEERETVRRNVHVEDVSRIGAKIAAADRNGQVTPQKLAEDLVIAYRDAGLAMMVLDPVSLLGPGELSGNDGAAEFMRICRKLAHRLRCAVRPVHHVAKAIAREAIFDQYAGRGGGAFADNSRFVHQFAVVTSRAVKFEGGEFAVPLAVPDAALANGEVIVVMTHKLSYARRERRPVVLWRQGFEFTHVPVERVAQTPEAREERASADVMALVAFLEEHIASGKWPTAKSIETGYLTATGMTKSALRAAIARGQAEGLIVEGDLPRELRKGSRKTYLKPVNQVDLTVGASQ